MNTILQHIDPNIAYALGWTIIHSLWQASLVALMMSLIHRYAKYKSSSFRYGVSVLSMLSVLIFSVFTFIFYFSSTSTTAVTVDSISLGQMISGTVSELTILGQIQSFFSKNLDHINLIWAVGVLLFLSKFLLSYLYTKYLKHTSFLKTSIELERSLKRIQDNLAIDTIIQIAESTKISVPMVLGHIKPLILFPVGLINVLNTEEVEAIITHEIAHIKRFDYLTNLFLTLVETLYYFHPAIWWISANVKAEREKCCDDFSLCHNIDKMVYAKALVKLEEIKSTGIPSLAMPFAEKKHQLLNRIKRIMNMPQTQNDIKEKSLATILLLSMVLLFSNQANSEIQTTENLNSSFELQADTIRLQGEEEMILKVTDGKFESLTVDNEVQSNEIVDLLATTINKNNENSKDKKSYTLTIKDSPEMEVINEKVEFRGQGGVMYESDEDIKVSTLQLDTLPKIEWDEGTTLVHEDDSSISILTKYNGKVIEIEKEKGEVTKLIIDGKEIPKSEYGNYRDELEAANKVHQFDGDFSIFDDFEYFEGFEDFKGKDFSKSFGLLFDGEEWREFGGNINQLFDKDVIEKLKDIDNFKFDFKQFDEMDHFRNGEEMEKLQEMLEELGIQMDSSFQGMNFKFNFDDFEGFEGFDNFEGFEGFEELNEKFFEEFDDEDITIFRNGDSRFKKGTVVDKIGGMLNKDGLLEPYKSNKVEITGKHLKINGEKMPKAIYQKYKDIYQESTGAPLTKGSKMVFDVEGKPSKRKVKTF